MILIANELVSNSTPLWTRQKITTRNTVVRLGAIRPHILKYGSPSGSLFMRIQNSSGVTLADSEVVTIASISAVAYWHGYLRFNCNYILAASTDYFIQLCSLGGYSYADAAYIAWCSAYNDPHYDRSYSPSSGFNSPLAMELWEYKTIMKGTYP